jgi:hypothetical protein
MKVGKDLWELPPKLLRNYEHVTTLAKIPSHIWVTSLRQFPVLDLHGLIMRNIPETRDCPRPLALVMPLKQGCLK